MSCEAYRDRIDELVDGTLDGAGRRELDAHLATCAECRALADDLLAIRRAAGHLPPLMPPDRIWQQIAPRVSAPIRAVSRPTPNWRERLAVPLAVAAVLLAAVAITAVMRQWRNPSAPSQTSSAAATGAVPGSSDATAAELKSLQAELELAQTHFENAIQKLDALAKDQRGLDPQVAANLQKAQLVIDQSIDESRAALKVNPANERAQESLFEAFRTKISLLQDTISLINEMRKGNQAEAAKIADGLNKS
jgi:putative zinc finger protein